jgi:hypothetical protein
MSNDHRSTGQRAARPEIHPRGTILRLAIQCRYGQEGERQEEDVH